MKIAILGTRGIPNHYSGFEQFAEGYFLEESTEIEQGNGIRGCGAIGKSHVAIMAESTVLENLKQYHSINQDLDAMKFIYFPNNSINSKALLVVFTFSKVNKSRNPAGVCFSFITQIALFFWTN